MKICGIVVEYNPFHNGHIYHLQQARLQTNCDLLVAVMSPHFVQRGEPAITDKWKRAKAALRHGADLVLELPTLHAVQSASYFASAAIDILALANVDTIIFGSESSNIEKLQQYAKKLQSISLDERTISTVRQYENKLGALLPNDILGINYIQAAKKHQIQTRCIQRTNAYHSKHIDSHIASASAIRHHFFNGDDVTPYTILANELDPNARLHTYYPYLQTRLLLDDPNRMKQLFLMDEGIEHRLIEAAKQYDDMDSFLSYCISARYTRSRIQRTLIHYLLDTSKQEANLHAKAEHLRILAFNTKSRVLLKQLQKEGKPVISRFQQLPAFYQQMEQKATVLYTYGNPALRKQLLKKELEGPYYDADDR